MSATLDIKLATVSNRQAPPDQRGKPRKPGAGQLWLVNHIGATVLRCRVLDRSEGGLRLRVPCGYGIAEGQAYELCTQLPGEFGAVGSRTSPRQWVTVVRTSTLEGDDEEYVDVGVTFETAPTSLSAF